MAGGAGRGEAKRRPRRLVALRLRGRGWTRALCSASPSPIGHCHHTVTVVTVRSPPSPHGRRMVTVAVWSPVTVARGHRAPPSPSGHGRPNRPERGFGVFFFFWEATLLFLGATPGLWEGAGGPARGPTDPGPPGRRRFTASEQRPGCAMRIPPPTPG